MTSIHPRLLAHRNLVSMRGAHEYPVLIRTTDPNPGTSQNTTLVKVTADNAQAAGAKGEFYRSESQTVHRITNSKPTEFAHPRLRLTGVAFGGPNFDTLYITGGG